MRSPRSRRAAPTLGRENSRTADSAPKQQEPGDEHSDDGGPALREAEPTDIAWPRFVITPFPAHERDKGKYS